MEVLSALFSAIWSRFTGAAWFEYVRWPFWTFLVLIAIGGVYQAKFGKNTLVCRGITGALKLALIYMVIVGLYIIFPSYMSRVSQYPFLSMTETTMTLVNPLGLFDRWKTTLPEVMVRLYFLLFLINTAGSFDYSGKGTVSWQANLWTEYVPNFHRAQEKLLPRMAATAEAAWSSGKKDFNDFARRLGFLRRLYDKEGIHYATYFFDGVDEIE